MAVESNTMLKEPIQRLRVYHLARIQIYVLNESLVLEYQEHIYKGTPSTLTMYSP